MNVSILHPASRLQRLEDEKRQKAEAEARVKAIEERRAWEEAEQKRIVEEKKAERLRRERAHAEQQEMLFKEVSAENPAGQFAAVWHRCGVPGVLCTSLLAQVHRALVLRCDLQYSKRKSALLL